MTYYGYIDENNVPDDHTIIEDSTYLGKEIGEKLAHLAVTHRVDLDGFSCIFITFIKPER